MLKILFIGDISGKIGRKAVTKILPKLKKELKPDLIIANAENLAHGKGLTETTLNEMIKAGVDWFTGGDHSFSMKKKLEDIYNSGLPVLRPANYSSNIPGKGYALIKIKQETILLISLIGRVFMRMDYDCPFKKLASILSDPVLASKKISAIIIDIHAEATSEKIALSCFADGRVSAILGTHTHVMTADHKITSKGTAHITDVGMTGFTDGIIGLDKKDIIKTFLTQIKYPHIIPEKGQAIFNSVFLTINPKNAKTQQIKPITKFINIKQ